MYIDFKRKNGKTLFIMRFKDEEERDACFKQLQNIADVLNEFESEKCANCFKELVDTIKHKCNDKYPIEGQKYSVMLFDDQMIVLAMGLWWYGDDIIDSLLKDLKDK